ncbi:MAG TPA: DUF4097 family beta strand repeat-containing protein [Terriglobales bacterium]|nr:DUF4097 family beta strand repeat-containing protein [Terriglobales bacterium]
MAKNKIIVAIAVLMLSLTAAAEPAKRRDWGSELKVSEQETIRNTYTVGTNPDRTLDVDNIFGSVEVVGTTGDQVQLVVLKTIRAESAEKIALAKKEVTLDVSQENGGLKLYVNGPFRCRNCDFCQNNREDSGYLVKMDFQLQVPNRMKLKVRTVNDGNVRGVAGDFLVRNVNGSINMSEVAGSGSATTVNGKVNVAFRENPKADSEFKSINGNVELQFVRDLSADFRFKTMNGDVFSDFALTALPQRAASSEKKNGKFVIRGDRYTGGRVGAGGPEIKIENLNGDIRVIERHV